MFATVPLFQGNPISFLRLFKDMSQRRDRGKIGFDEQDLHWCVQVWSEVVMAGVGNPARDHFIHEKERYEKLFRDLSTGNAERKEGGFTFLNESADWPMGKVIDEAIKCLEHADIKVLH